MWIRSQQFSRPKLLHSLLLLSRQDKKIVADTVSHWTLLPPPSDESTRGTTGTAECKKIGGGGVSSTVHNLPHLVGIRLTDLPKLGVASGNPVAPWFRHPCTTTSTTYCASSLALPPAHSELRSWKRANKNWMFHTNSRVEEIGINDVKKH